MPQVQCQGKFMQTPTAGLMKKKGTDTTVSVNANPMIRVKKVI